MKRQFSKQKQPEKRLTPSEFTKRSACFKRIHRSVKNKCFGGENCWKSSVVENLAPARSGSVTKVPNERIKDKKVYKNHTYPLHSFTFHNQLCHSYEVHLPKCISMFHPTFSGPRWSANPIATSRTTS